MAEKLTLDALKAMDAADPLKEYADRFLIPEGVIYMNGNSLGPLTKDAKKRMASAVENEWGNELIRGWNTAGWYDMSHRVGNKIAKLIGASEGEVVLADSTSVNLFKTLVSALHLNPGRRKIISEKGNFPTDLYIIDGVRQLTGEHYTVETHERADVMDAIGDDTAVVLLTHVHYVSGEIFPMAEITEKAHACGALTVWDLSHSVGAVETELNATKADFAVGCGYKHLNGGPGAPAFLFAAKRHHGAMKNPISGWFSHKAPFQFVDEFEPTEGIGRMLTGTTAVLGGSALEAGLDLMLETENSVRFQKQQKLNATFQALVLQECGGLGLEVVSPQDASDRGAHISFRHNDGYAIMQNLIDMGVIGDFRAPDRMRFGFSPLFMSFESLYHAVEILRDILKSKSYQQEKYQTVNKVT
ncbi:kynureninase [Kordiimonas sp. SCSIO 12603]|uniref:kynureninase n=1 Tax=Kordiimonas sp. SCSIO 12603 TaxID=2829596 RepID=UPI002101EDE8|nr:kynureninase [Kordiimonas sp. SCSIO 12603]